jgi:hypothetical protein
VPPLSPERVGLAEHGRIGETPLWFYILKEADVLHNGDRLGPVGGGIIGETLVGIIDAAPESLRSVARDWAPTLPRSTRRAVRLRLGRHPGSSPLMPEPHDPLPGPRRLVT